MNIKTVKVVANKELKSISVEKKVKESIKEYGLILVNNSPDLVIVVGGDGTFISALTDTLGNFNNKCLYVGINTGHLGFLQEVKVEEIDELFKSITTGNFKVENISIEEIEVFTEGRSYKYYGLNEVMIRNRESRTIELEIQFNEKHYSSCKGDGINISTSTGSTAYNLSLGGSLVYPSLKTLQLIPIAPLPISTSYATLRNGIIVPEDMTITIIPKLQYMNKVKTVIDSKDRDWEYVEKINITTPKEGIRMLRFNNYDYFTRINEKFLKFAKQGEVE